MRWYEGNIAEAVSASKTKGAVFVVYIEGKDDKSKEFTTLIGTEEVSAQLENDHFVAIKVEEDSVPHQQFKQIYQQATAPSIFFIGKNGSPIEIITEPHPKLDFINKLQQILHKHGVPVSNKPTLSTQSLINNEKETIAQDANSSSTIQSNPATSNVEEDEEIAGLSVEEKMERIQELINKKRLEKQAEEEEKAREQEIERRKMGQDVQKLKRWQHEQELKEMMEIRNKEKKEQLEARQRVLAQIAQDKAERASKFSNISPTTQSQPSSQPIARNTNIARLQFKFPDGSTNTKEFPSNDTLQTVRNYIIGNLNLPYPNFTLSTTFPRREFTERNFSDTLLELMLVPNAVILILPLQHGAVTTNTDSWFMTLFWSFVAPILGIIGYLKMKLFGGGPSSPSSASTRSNNRQPVSDNESSSTIPKKKAGGESSVIRRQGNVHRLQDNADSDDDNNTWNGNSTQQM